MKKLIKQVFIFTFIITVLFTITLLRANNGYSDPFYKRFTSPKQESLIIGTSKAAQGLQPSAFKKYFSKNIYNYSFTIVHSPYGIVYYNSIKKKLKENTKNGLFILTVDPWSISSNTKNPNDSKNFTENDLCLAYTSSVNINPNLEYIFEKFSGKYYKLFSQTDKSMFLHDDGWLEVTAEMDSLSVTKRKNEKINTYKKENLPNFKLSEFRLKYLKKTIQFLKLHGDVYLLRMPIHPDFFKLEQKLMPQFNEVISEIVPLTNGYLDLTTTNSKYTYIDGIHLWKESGLLVSEVVANWVAKKEKSE
ncbi:hypothetical protein [Flavobacterium terrae]|uniref:Uncharacterized protein n=1 Tax=Flavobacterium terrae TaxID=415425 RepID=A0A1M6GJD4_9FLAO|nr:hypothetical protein [Flavobacterium terrae]SHJ10032.1 hypothetical protein SAMN05444363_2646 [Flavobacterium terrae]